MSKILIGKYEATIYPEQDGYTGAISLGFDGRGRRKRIKRKGRTKEAVKDKLREAVNDLESGIKASPNYTVTDAVTDWLAKGLKGRTGKTVETLSGLAGQHVVPEIGAIKLGRLSADDVDEWLDGLTGKLSTRTLQTVHSILKRSIRQAQARDKVMRNVAELVTTPKGRDGRPSRALTLDQAGAVLEAARTRPLYAYVVLSLMTGIRTEEARALRWDHVQAWTGKDGGWRPVTEVGFDHERFAGCVWRSVRVHGDTKTEKSRRTLELPEEAVTALQQHRTRQAAQRLEAGALWQDHGLVFCTQTGTPLDAHNVRRAFRGVTKAAGLGKTWCPRELRHTFVSIMSDNDVPVEKIADLVGHKGTLVTERVYRHQLKPVITKGAETMNTVFSKQKAAGAEQAPTAQEETKSA
jgi:integrase